MSNRHHTLRAAFARAQVKTSAGEAGGEKETTMSDGSDQQPRCTCPDTARLLTAYLAGRGREVGCDLHRPTGAPADSPVPLNSERLEAQLLAALTNRL